MDARKGVCVGHNRPDERVMDAMERMKFPVCEGRPSILRRWAVGLLLLACALLFAWSASYAHADTFDEAQTGLSLTVKYQADAVPEAGILFSLYRVADVDEDLQFSMTGDFAGYPVVLQDLDSAGYKAAAETLASYAARDALKPFAQGVTDESGTVSFSSNSSSLVAGLYLLVGDSFSTNGRLWVQEPSLICLPSPDGKGYWSAETTVAPKVSDGGEATRVEVHKAWNDGDSATRPASVTVQLLRDGSVADEALLTVSNDWSYAWEDLAPGYVWGVAEKDVAAGYTVSVEREGSTFVITNAKASGQPGTKLPQTGQLWWPVPVLLVLGLLCLVVGVVRRRSGLNGPRE